MPGSGFQLDSNQLTPGYYSVTITMTNTTTYPVYSGSGNPLATQGGVNPYDWTQGSIYTGGLPSSAGYATALAQGNIRFDRIVELLSSYSDAKILDPSVTVGGTSANYQPTAVSFTVAFDRDEFILPEYNKVQIANGATSAGSTFTLTYQTQTGGQTFNTYYAQDGSTPVNSTSSALRDIITTAICSGGTTGWSRTYRVFSVSQNGDSQQTISIQQPATPATIFATVAVSPVGTTGLNF